MIRLIPIIILLMACQKDELLNPVDPELTEAQCIELGYQDECGVCDGLTINYDIELHLWIAKLVLYEILLILY